MLVLGRREGESICVGKSVKITVLKIAGRQIQLGISAPEKIAIIREELKRKGRIYQPFISRFMKMGDK